MPEGPPYPLHQRIPEPEIMDEDEQVRAYAEADFSAPHEMFVDLFEERLGKNIEGLFLDLGCGPCDISVRFLKRFPKARLHALDASAPMLTQAKRLITKENLKERIRLFHARLPLTGNELPCKSYDGLIVNSLLHHLPNQAIFWDAVEELVKPGGVIFVMDLLRPKDKETAQRLVETYSGSEPEILKRDFYNSLLAAYRDNEVSEFLKKTNLSHLTVEVVSDRHFLVWGKR